MKCHMRKISKDGKRKFCFLSLRPYEVIDIIDNLVVLTFDIGIQNTTVIVGIFGFAVGVEWRI